MPFAAVLTRSSCCFCLRLSRFHARKGISGSGPCPVTLLRHLANLQARIHSVKESRYFIYESTSAPQPPRPCTIIVLHSEMRCRYEQPFPCTVPSAYSRTPPSPSPAFPLLHLPL